MNGILILRYLSMSSKVRWIILATNQGAPQIELALA
jgi:hypothetical protein